MSRPVTASAGLPLAVTGIFGIAFVALFAVGAIALQGAPLAYDEPISQVRALTDDNSRNLVGDYVAGVGFLLAFLPYVACMHPAGRRRGEPAGRILSWCWSAGS